MAVHHQDLSTNKQARLKRPASLLPSAALNTPTSGLNPPLTVNAHAKNPAGGSVHTEQMCIVNIVAIIPSAVKGGGILVEIGLWKEIVLK